LSGGNGGIATLSGEKTKSARTVLLSRPVRALLSVPSDAHHDLTEGYFSDPFIAIALFRSSAWNRAWERGCMENITIESKARYENRATRIAGGHSKKKYMKNNNLSGFNS
jgi:hypothetical protein